MKLAKELTAQSEDPRDAISGHQRGRNQLALSMDFDQQNSKGQTSSSQRVPGAVGLH